YEKYQAERRMLVTRAQTQRSWSEQGVRAVKRSGETDKFIRHKNKQSSEKQAAKAKQTDKARERLEARAVEKPWEGWQLDLVFATGERSGAVVARLDAAVVHRGSFTLGPLDLEIEWQERLAIVGPNGSGKTTLLRALLGEQPLDAGSRWVGPGVRFGTLDQARSVLATEGSLLDAFCARTGLLATEGRSQLAKLGLDAVAVARTPSVLSPGERSRAILAALAAGESNCLVLDEPTNHLDLPAIEQLEAALDGYPGTLLLVTHDRRLLESVEVTRTLDLRRPA
ncbi:MAG: ATP-binding cassette domain-containing protein, partial [Acidimicrobiia bacterium]